MTVTQTPRFRLPQWSQGSDPRPGRVDTNQIHQLIESQAAKVYPSGTYSNRPASGTFGSFFMATDQGESGRLYWDGGDGWVALNTTGGGGAGRPIIINGTATEGTSLQSARADHTHRIPLATASNAGAMPSQWAERMENATAAAAPNTLAVRDSSGRLIATKPAAAGHVTTKDYVDTDAGSTGRGGLTLARRDSAGRINVSPPVTDYHATTKRYVDERVPEFDKYARGDTLIQRWSTGRGGNVEDPDNPMEIANRRFVLSRASRTAWKTNIEPLDDVLDDLCEINVVRYDYKDDAPDTGHGIHGALVEQVARHLPNLTTTGDDGEPERIKDRELTWVLLKGLQEAVSRVNALEEELDNLYTRIGGDDDA